MNAAWKAWERRGCRELGGERAGPQGKHGSDGDHTIPYAAEFKYTVRYSLQQKWLDQARRQSKAEGKPWILAISEHNDRTPIAVVDFYWLASQLRQLPDQPT